MSAAQSKAKPMELLAPAGSLDAFSAAVAAGADAVYIGAPALNARALAKQFSLAEIAAMIDHAHGRGVKVYAAMNSLMKEAEIPAAVKLLAALAELKVDAVILQDLGVYGLARDHFPSLRLHASTLMLAHNSMAVRHFAAMGFARVVLAREVTIAEIRQFRQQSPVELEVFVQGAMCFSYSGLCLFSSYLGGKSGLRGRCVQPCRRRYLWQGSKKEGGYLFSMNDLSALRLLPELKAAGVGSLKIEGRMRSAQYVAQVVAAYRLALDHAGDETALAEAEAMLGLAMGRKATVGYFRTAQPAGIITPHHSGNIGIFLGKIERLKGGRAVVLLRDALRSADRLRLHGEGSGERQSFTLRELRLQGKPVAEAAAGARVEIAVLGAAHPGDSLYKVDVSERRALAAGRQAIDPRHFARLAGQLEEPKQAGAILARLGIGKAKVQAGRREGKGRPATPASLPLWLKVDDLRLLNQRLPAEIKAVAALLVPETMAQYQKLARPLAPLRQKLVWALPPVILEADMPFYAKAVAALRDQGFVAWQLSHVSQVGFFAGRGKARGPGRGAGELAGLHGDYRLNVLNSVSQRVLSAMGLATVEAAVETDRESLAAMAAAKAGPLGLMVHGRPPLFTARLMPRFFRYDQPFVSPRNEVFELKKAFGQTVAVAQQPFSLLSFQAELVAMGVAYGVVDLSHMGMGLREAAQFLRTLGKAQSRQRLSTFNYRGTLP
ncbi:MAG: peptidase U32 family protein [Thermodesulfobacteriota bacterium]